jgi:hypothetical protein
MPLSGAIIFSDLIGKLDVLRGVCESHSPTFRELRQPLGAVIRLPPLGARLLLREITPHRDRNDNYCGYNQSTDDIFH